MTTRRDPDQLIRAFLDEGRTELPDRAYEAVREQIDRTSQRVVIGPWRTPFMTKFAGLAAAAVAVLAIGFVGFTIVRPDPNPVVGVSPPIGPTMAPSLKPAASPVVLPAEATLIGGVTYRIEDPLVTPVPFTLTVPDGWRTINYAILLKTQAAEFDETTMQLSPWAAVSDVYVDSCRWHGGVVQPRVGRSVDDLADALAAQGNRNGVVSDVAIDGYEGKRVELKLPDDLDVKSCDGGEARTWSNTGTQDPGGYVYGNGQADVIYILDVEGKRLVLHTSWLPGTPVADRSDLDAMVQSIDFDTAAQGSSQAPS